MAGAWDPPPGGTWVVSWCRGQGDAATLVLIPRLETLLALSGTWSP